MGLPGLLATAVGDEDVFAEMSLGGKDQLAFTPTRTLVYRGEGLLSDESVSEYGHDVERIEVVTGRRKARITLGYGPDGDETLSVPTERVDEVVRLILAGVLSADGVAVPGETFIRTFRFSALTLIVTSERLVEHVGSAVWDAGFEEFHYADLTSLDFGEGAVATEVTLVHNGHSERFKIPNTSASTVRETLADAVCSFHDVDKLEEFRVAAEAEESVPDGASSDTTNFSECSESLSASRPQLSNGDINTPSKNISSGGRIPNFSDICTHRSVNLSYDNFQFDKESDLIGTGGEAQVYRAQVPNENLTIALKQPSFNATVSTETREQILNEARNWSLCDDHPHIVEVIDWGTKPGPWIALEYMDGGPLTEYIGTMSVEQRLWTVYSIASAVAHANIKGLAHSDIKPNNILFRKTPDGQWDFPKVADWGQSREIIEATGSISQVTPNYAAPEHFEALMPNTPVDEQTDAYQLGVVCYEILTGTHPSHLSEDVPLPTRVDESLPAEIDNLISTTITHDRDNRIEHSLLFRQRVGSILSDQYPMLLGG